ncbi:uncharacterized protein Dwil_GK20631 [Drosophila willistoni]|uniref:Uncharacterized protein n=1 Tax=Drosophila willistoni TaxID=7260 RepID=B4MKD5_DROWI|nr:uncharacterized protein LOC6638211 isoform X2 [Drosophila willistoni]EDW72574.1 uncharacterized protein Dwil_GK20631 [Drosophila willistoni]
MCDEGPITDCEPTTLSLNFNSYHIHMPLYIMDMVRVFQDHPKYCNGIQAEHILEMLEKEPCVCGDLEAQVKTALLDLTSKGFIRYVGNGYRTLGPIAKLANARSARHFNMNWQRIAEAQKVNCPSLEGCIPSTNCK